MVRADEMFDIGVYSFLLDSIYLNLVCAKPEHFRLIVEVVYRGLSCQPTRTVDAITGSWGANYSEILAKRKSHHHHCMSTTTIWTKLPQCSSKARSFR